MPRLARCRATCGTARTRPLPGVSLPSSSPRRSEEIPVPVTASDAIKILFAILLPPVGVFLEVGLKGHFWLNILLTLLGFIPGVIHALYVIIKH
jgi:uncharacterized membrane protein YqaE (UPF0057 family)